MFCHWITLSRTDGIMPARKPSSPDEKPQIERFIEAAREHGASEDSEEFERIFRKVVKPKATTPSAPPLRRNGKQSSRFFGSIFMIKMHSGVPPRVHYRCKCGINVVKYLAIPGHSIGRCWPPPGYFTVNILEHRSPIAASRLRWIGDIQATGNRSNAGFKVSIRRRPPWQSGPVRRP